MKTNNFMQILGKIALLLLFLVGLLYGIGRIWKWRVAPHPFFAQFDHSPIVIAHRGASGERPEHTLEAYRLAIAQGADYIEPDLVMSADGVLFARHDPWLSDSTDIAARPEFADRRRTLTGPEGEVLTDWWTFDFTAAELKTLRARQVRELDADGQLKAPTRFRIPLGGSVGPTM